MPVVLTTVGAPQQVQVDFTHDPTSASFTWVDITNRARSASYRRGRSYERNQVEAGGGTVKLRNDDGALDPTNGASPYSPNVLPFRRFQHNVTVGGTTYPIFTGLVERWPQEWEAGYGSSPVEVVDIFAWLALAQLRSVVQQEVLGDGPPVIYLPLTDDSAATAPTMVVAPAGAVASILQAANGGGAFAFAGGPGPVAEGTQALKLTPTTQVNGYVVNVNLQTPILAGATTAAIRVNYNGPGDATINTMLVSGRSDANFFPMLGIGCQASTGRATAWVNGTAVVASLGAINDSKPHDLLVTVSAGTTTLYVDGVNVGSAGGAAALGAITTMQVGGDTVFGGAEMAAGTYSHAAIYGTATVSAADHYNAGANGFAGETADARIARILAYAGWTASAALDPCATTMLGATDLSGKSALAAIQEVQASEGGVFFASKAGVLTYKSRRTRMTTTASAVTFGENTAAGEVPYLNLAFDFDPTYVYNDVQIDRTGSGHAIAAASATSQSHYGQRTYSATFGTQSDTEAQDAANWLLNTNLAPHLRVRSVTIDCLATPGAWAAVLPLEVGSRVTAKKRPANGTTITANSFVESIAWDIVDGKRAQCTLELSPIPLQALIADDATYGICDSTFVAAW